MLSASEHYSQAGPSRLPLGNSTHEIKAVQGRRSTASPRRRRARVVPALVYCAVAAALGAAPHAVRAQDAAAGLSSGSVPLAGGTGSSVASAQPQRWGQASALVDSLFLVHGGKTQGDSPGQGGFTYTSGPNSGELLALDLAQSFNPASPPWQSVNVSGATPAPAVSFHSLAPLQQGSQRVLLFGGDATGTLPIQTGNDSSYVLQLQGSGSSRTATWTRGETAWAEPMRRIYHSAESDARGGVWIVGGERDDGSGIMMDETWSFNASDATPAFQQIAPPAGSVVDGTVTRLSDGTLLLLGGLDASGAAHSFANILSYSPQRQLWGQTAARGANDSAAAFPTPRRSHVAVSLPDRRVFLHGGATADLSTAFGDAWILDWSADTPYWTQVESPGAPAARYGHAAAAWGRQIVLSFGWSGGNAADTTAHVFDAISMQSLGNGAWSGGQWSSSYSPDPAAASTGKNSGSNGSSSNTGSPSSNGNGGSTTKTFGTPTASSSDEPKSDSGPSAGVKAGAFLAAFIGVGLIAGGSYAVYRRRQTAPENWRRGEGAAGLLGGAGGRAYDDDDAYMLEKGEGGGGGGALGSYEQGGRVMGPRPLGASPATWTAGNIGHAMEGSGPHLRERIAMITGFGFGGAAAGQTRFDMLADEDDEHAYGMSGKAGMGAGARAYRASATDPDDEPVDVAMRVRERSYGRLEQDDIEEEYSMGDIGGRGADDAAHFVTSPFEDEEDSHALRYGAAGGLLAVGAAAAAVPRSSFGSDAGRSDDNGTTPAASAQSHTDSYTTTGATSSVGKSSGEGAMVSFSDATGSRRGPTSPIGPRAGPAAGMKRSPTWWNRFSFLERSASGRLLTGPTADEPIRDPARPPDLAAIRESPRSTQTSEDNPFGDAARTDDMGRLEDATALASAYGQHARSLSSLQSARTATSSQLETQLRNMDVVQRTRTASSRRTHSSTESEYESVGMLSRGPSTRRRPTNDDGTTPGSVVWDPSDWAGAGAGVPTTVPEEDSFGAAAMDMPSLQSGDLYAMQTPVLGAEPYQASPFAALRSRELHIRTEASEASITPATTKRARDNPQLTAPRSPLPRHEPGPPLQGSVKDRAKALDRKHTALGDEAVLPLPRSPVAPGSAHSSSPEPSSARAKLSPLRLGADAAHNLFADADESTSDARSSSPSRRALEASPERSKGATSPSGAASKDKVRYSHGLVPKAQLFVANPDRGSSGSS